MSPPLRKTRFVCVSDTHNASPTNGSFKLPKGDVMIHAGDLTNQGTLSELQRTIDWIEQADYEAKIVIAESRGPRTTFKVFGSPYLPARGLWAFGYQPEKASELWNQIPLNTDIVITHTPLKRHYDGSGGRGAAGCETLRQTLWRVRPRPAVCGHVHEGRAAERVRWDLSTLNMKYEEEQTSYWIDPGLGNNKQSLVDLSIRGGEPLDNDDNQNASGDPADPATTVDKPNRRSTCWSCLRPGRDKQCLPDDSYSMPSQPLPINASTSGEVDNHSIQCAASDNVSYEFPESVPHTDSLPPSRHCTLEAVTNRIGRRETCIINPAMMALSWPHKNSGGKRNNKPIVVDIDLPVWES